MSILYNRPQTARFIARPNRFIAHVLVGDEVVVCHVKNTGRCRELLLPGARVIIAPARNPLRKTAYDLIAVYKGEMLVNIDSQAPNALVHRYLSSRYPGAQVRPESRIGHSRLDFLVNLRPGWDSQAGPQPPESLLYVEVKGVTLEEGGIARFPDAPTPRGARHLQELARLAKQGHQALVLFVLQFRPAGFFCPNDAMDPAFGIALREAAALGVQVEALDCLVEEGRLSLGRRVPVRLQECAPERPDGGSVSRSFPACWQT